MDVDYKGLDGRHFYMKSRQLSGIFKIGSKIFNKEKTVSEISIAESAGSWQSLIDAYYPEFQKLLTDSRIHTIELNLNQIDVINLDEKPLYYFAQEQQYYLLNKLKYDENKASAEFVRVKRD